MEETEVWFHLSSVWVTLVRVSFSFSDSHRLTHKHLLTHTHTDYHPPWAHGRETPHGGLKLVALAKIEFSAHFQRCRAEKTGITSTSARRSKGTTRLSFLAADGLIQKNNPVLPMSPWLTSRVLAERRRQGWLLSVWDPVCVFNI